MRADYLSRQKQWEEEQARQATELAAEPDDEEMVADDNLDREPVADRPVCCVLMNTAETDLVEDYLTQEDLELSSMSSMLEDIQASRGNEDRAMSDYGSDDEEYNQLFMDVLVKLEERGAGVPIGASSQEKHEMDVSMG